MKITGLDSLIRKLDALGGDSEKVVTKTTKQTTRFVRDEARLRCPVDTGDLRQSIKDTVQVIDGHVIGTVGTNMEYAPYVEFGTGQIGEATNNNHDVSVAYRQDWKGQPAQPYLYPSLKDNEGKIQKKYKDDLQKAIRKVARS